MNILSFLASENWRPFFKPVAKVMGNDSAIILGELANKFEYYKARGMLDSEGWFYCSVEQLEEDTNLSKHKQTKAIRKMEAARLMEMKLKGVPATRHFRFPEDFAIQMAKILTSGQMVKNSPTRWLKNSQQDGENFDTNETREEDLKKETLSTTPLTAEDVSKKINLAGLLHETDGNRMAAWEFIEPWLDTDEFLDRWKWMTQDVAGVDQVEIKKVMLAWVQKGPWLDIRQLRINKIQGWVATEIKRQLSKSKKSHANERSEGQKQRHQGIPSQHSGNTASFW